MRLSNGFEWIYFLAATQGIFVALTLWFRRNNTFANRILSIAILAIAISSATVLGVRMGVVSSDSPYLHLAAPLDLLLAPLFYLYVTALISKQLPLPGAYLHFIPFGLAFMFRFYLMFDPGALGIWGQVSNRVANLQGIYFVAALIMLRRYRSSAQFVFSDLTRLNLRWLRFLIGSLILLWCASVYGDYVDPSVYPPIHAGLALIIYVIAYFSITQPEIFGLPLAGVAAQPKYRKSQLSSELSDQIKRALLVLMKEKKPFLDPEITLPALAKMLDVPTHQLSQVLNEGVGKSFYDFINGYRVEEFKRKLNDADASRDKLLSLGLDCGFNSKSSINSVFKKLTGMTPSQYRDRL